MNGEKLRKAERKCRALEDEIDGYKKELKRLRKSEK